LAAGQQLGSVAVHDGDEFVVFDVAESPTDVNLPQKSEMSEELAEAHVR
jgi:hypothetical protein